MINKSMYDIIKTSSKCVSKMDGDGKMIDYYIKQLSPFNIHNTKIHICYLSIFSGEDDKRHIDKLYLSLGILQESQRIINQLCSSRQGEASKRPSSSKSANFTPPTSPQQLKQLSNALGLFSILQALVAQQESVNNLNKLLTNIEGLGELADIWEFSIELKTVRCARNIIENHLISTTRQSSNKSQLFKDGVMKCLRANVSAPLEDQSTNQSVTNFPEAELINYAGNLDVDELLQGQHQELGRVLKRILYHVTEVSQNKSSLLLQTKAI